MSFLLLDLIKTMQLPIEHEKKPSIFESETEFLSGQLIHVRLSVGLEHFDDLRKLT